MEVSMTDESILDAGKRIVSKVSNDRFIPYNRYGLSRDDMEWIPLSGKMGEGFEVFMLRMQPGARSTPHEHTHGEEFYILEGDFVDCDGAHFGKGDYVCYQPGSKHFSHTESGCTLLVILHGPNTSIGQT